MNTRMGSYVWLLIALTVTFTFVSSKSIPEMEAEILLLPVPAEIEQLPEISPNEQGNSIPVAVLDFEGGMGDKSIDNQVEETSTRQKRTIGMIGRMATCFFTFLINPNCFNQMNMNNYQQRSVQPTSNNYYQQQMQYLQQQLAWQRAQNLMYNRYNSTDNGNSSYPYPILSTYPPSEQSTTQAPEDQPPTNPILDIINAKINFVPNMLRFIFPGIFGGQRRNNYGMNNYNSMNARPNYVNYNQNLYRQNSNNVFSG